jgi:YHS domain-containing protein
MSLIDDLERAIRERVARSDEQRVLRQNHLKQSMDELDERLRRYTAVADRLIETVIRPRLERLAACFETLNPPRWETTRHTCLLQFQHTPRFPASVTLELGVSRDGQATTVCVQYSVRIAPQFFALQGEDQLAMMLDDVDEAKAAAWVEARLLRFVDDYLRLETAAPYQDQNVVTDPVCGMAVNKAHAPAEMEHKGVRYYFCVEECRARFAEAPERYRIRPATGAMA